MRLTGTTYGNSLAETRAYRVSGSNKDNLTASSAITNVSGFSYTYDANKNKTAETDSIAGAYSWSTGTGGYDDKDRLVNWTRSNGNSQNWTLSKVGDWSTTTVNGTQEARTHNDAHELTARGAQALACDVKGNLTRGAGRLGVTAAEWKVTRYGCDERSLVIEETYPDHVGSTWPGIGAELMGLDERDRTMNRATVTAVLAGLALVAALAPDAAGMYDPDQGRFAARDPLGYVDGMSLYEYVAGRPMSYGDPSGLATEVCQYSGEGRVTPDPYVTTLSRDPTERIAYPTKIKHVRFKCKCEVQCISYTFSPTLSVCPTRNFLGGQGIAVDFAIWVRNPSGDRTDWTEVDHREDFASYDDYIADWRYFSKGAAVELYNSVLDALRREWAQKRGSGYVWEPPGIDKIGKGIVGAHVGNLLFEAMQEKGIISVEDVWNIIEHEKSVVFAEKCRQTCAAKKGAEK